MATAIYDTLTTINSKGQIVPFLAKSVTPDATFTHWTVQLRSGIQFQDGEPLDANAVKLNLDTYRGDNPNIASQLSPFSLKPITSVDVTGPLTLELTTSEPWPALALVPVRHGPHRHRRPRPAGQQPGVPHAHDRDRTVRARELAAQRGPHRQAEPPLLAAGAPVPRRDQVRDRHRRGVDAERPRRGRLRRHPDGGRAEHPRAAGAQGVRAVERVRHRRRRRGRLRPPEPGEAAVQRHQRAPRGPCTPGTPTS